jgi:serine/threonine protein kinase
MTSKNNPKFLASGAYGCVYDPGVPCKRKAKNKEKPGTTPIVTKLFISKQEAINEEKQNNLMAKIDPRGLFTIRSFGQCAYSEGSISKEELEKCDLSDSDDDEPISKKLTRQIVYEHGGITMNKAVKLYPFDELFRAIGPIFQGIVSILDRNLVHMDINHVNIVYNKTSQKMSLIDFGFCRPLNRVYYKNYSAFMFDYRYMPPEFSNALKHYRKIDHDPMSNYRELLGLCYLEPALEKRLTSKKTFEPNTDPSKIDVYMLGCVILQMSCAYDDLLIGTKLGRALIHMIEQMLCLDASKRVSAKDALALYKETLTILNEKSKSKSKTVKTVNPWTVNGTHVHLPFKTVKSEKSVKSVKSQK